MLSTTVIIPAYNSAATIVEALESVAAQSCRPDEVIVVDDGSTDDTVAVTRRWVVNSQQSTVNSRGREAIGDLGREAPSTGRPLFVTVTTLPRNSGPAAARNAGVRQAHGEWIAFLDADDVWLRERLELQMACLIRHPKAVMLCGGRREFGGAGGGEQSTVNSEQLIVNSEPLTVRSQQGKVEGGGEKAEGGRRKAGDVDPNAQRSTPNAQRSSDDARSDESCPRSRTLNTEHLPQSTLDPRPSCDGPALREVTLEELARHNPIVTSTVLVKRAAFEAAGGFDEQFRGPEDYDLWIRVAGQGRILELVEPLACYRHRPGSLSLDERRFLPQVLRVLDKAFGPGGALQGKPEWRHAALATQYQQASWMAFCRGARVKAILYLANAFCHNLLGIKSIQKPWFTLLVRYILGWRTPKMVTTVS